MDNNLINIDELFKQRLGGGEERERDGAWLRMKELLDEDDRRRPAGFYWRRVFTYVGVAALLASVSFGSYKYTAYRDGAGIASVATGTAANAASSASLRSAASPLKADASEQPAADGGVQHTGKPVSTAQYNHATRHSDPNSTAVVASNSSSDNNHSENNNDHSNTTAHTNNTTSAHSLSAGNAVASAAAGSGSHDHPAHLALHSAASLTKATTPGAASGAEHSSYTASGSMHKHAHHAAGQGGGSGSTAADSKNSMPGGDLSNATASTERMNRDAIKMEKTAPGVIAKQSVAPVKNEGVALQHITPAGALSPAVVKTNTPAHTSPSANSSEHHGSATAHTVAADNAGTHHQQHHTAAKTEGADAIPAMAVTTHPAHRHLAGTGATGNVAADKAITSSAPAHKGAGISNTGGAVSEEPAVTVAREKKTIQKIIIRQRLEGPSADIHRATMDTISDEIVTEEGSSSAAHTANRIAAAGSSQSASEPADPKALAAASKSAGSAIDPLKPAGNQAMDNLKANTGNKSGLSTAQKLSEAFNDVKYKIDGIQFAPGLTFGLNGTFFGPSSFRGFQFGVTGLFVLDEEWSFMAEVKYFNRSNNNFAIYDKYVDYAKNDSVTNTYSFSTLHSFELPLSVRYCVNKFNFYAGFNLAYALGINTGAEPLATSLVNTPAPGQKSAPSLSATDFDSRWGIGYLCGFSFQVSDNVSLDFRNTQGLWDNVKGAGGKYVSGQLYKSPSLQFSIGYRFNGKKGKQ